MRLSFRSAGAVFVAPDDARYHRYMSLSPRFVMLAIAEWKDLRVSGLLGKAARSTMRRA